MFEMKPPVFIVLGLMLAALAATPLFAQTPETAAESPQTAFVTVDLAAGNPLDPFIVSLNGGGEVDASTLDESCVGFITERPTLTINWSGDAEFVEAFFYSEHDPVLVVQSPDGSYQCNDDTNELLLDPAITMQDPAEGEYKIWVGSFDEGQLIPGILVLTTRPEINLGTFDLGGLVDRDLIAEDLIESEDALPAGSPSDMMTQTLTQTVTQPVTQTVALTDTRALPTSPETVTAEQLPFTTAVAVSGTIPAFEFESLGDICNGLLEPLPSVVLELTGDEDSLDIFFDSDSDSTLVVETPDGKVLCNDDSLRDQVANDEVEEEVNLNPLVTLTGAAPGRYYIYVGRLNDSAGVEGILTITNAGAADMPVLANPVQGEGE
jgi:hypothetical protein